MKQANLLALLLATILVNSSSSADRETFTNEHIDFSIAYDAALPSLDLELFVERSRVIPVTNAILVAKEGSKLTLPAGTPFGDEGDPIWVLPQSQDTSLLYCGFSAERIPFGVFDGPIQVELVSVEGPGNFLIWQSTSVGELEIKMNSRDGISADDKTSPIIGSHEHVNVGFSTNGIYHVTFRTAGRRIGEETNVVSEPRTLLFHVLPLPPLTPFASWQLENFGEGAAESIQGAAADPDNDSLPNIFEYAFGLNPLDTGAAKFPGAWVDENGAGIELFHATRATDLLRAIEFTDTLSPPNWKPADGDFEIVSETSGVQQIRFHDADSLETQRFYRLQLSLTP